MKSVSRLFSDIVKKTGKPLRTSAETFNSESETGYSANIPATIDTRSNEILAQVLESGKISLKDENLGIKSADLKTIQAFGESALQAELGSTKLYGNDQILLEDVDPKNIPRDKEIVIWPKKAKIFAIGVPDNEVIDVNINKKIFHETKARHGAGFTWKSYLKMGLSLPFLYFFAVYLEILREYWYVKSFYVAVDRENLEMIGRMKETAEVTIETQKKLLRFYPESN